MYDPNDKSLDERISDLLDDADNPSVSDDEYERRREELEKEKHEENVANGYE